MRTNKYLIFLVKTYFHLCNKLLCKWDKWWSKLSIPVANYCLPLVCWRCLLNYELLWICLVFTPGVDSENSPRWGGEKIAHMINHRQTKTIISTWLPPGCLLPNYCNCRTHQRTLRHKKLLSSLWSAAKTARQTEAGIHNQLLTRLCFKENISFVFLVITRSTVFWELTPDCVSNMNYLSLLNKKKFLLDF